MTHSNLLISLILFILLFGCNSNKKNENISSPEMKMYTYRFSMESVGNYKVEFQLNPDSTYQIEQHNYFFDRHAGTNTPNSKQGVMTTDEFADFDKLVRESNLYDMNDSYGFDDSSDNSIIYVIELHEGERTKYVSINAETKQKFTDEFAELIELTTQFMNSKLVD